MATTNAPRNASVIASSLLQTLAAMHVEQAEHKKRQRHQNKQKVQHFDSPCPLFSSPRPPPSPRPPRSKLHEQRERHALFRVAQVGSKTRHARTGRALIATRRRDAALTGKV